MNDTAFFENIVQNKRTALVIGGAGFLGSHVCGRLLDERCYGGRTGADTTVRHWGSSMKILVTGGAGYIGSHACKALMKAGHEPVVYDNLSTGHRDAVRWGPIEIGDILDHERFEATFASQWR